MAQYILIDRLIFTERQVNRISSIGILLMKTNLETLLC